jgi:6-pyruvoyl tetrahydropterin synthase/QueD family protein
VTYEIGKTFAFEAAHQLVHHDGVCARPHGHSYTFELIVEGAALHLDGPKAGMLDDFHDVNSVGGWIVDMLDHRNLNEVLDSDTTTAEHLSATIFDLAATRLPNLVEVRVKETQKTFSSYRPQRMEVRRALALGRDLMEDARARLYAGIDTTDPDACWPFSGSRDDGGYGWFNLHAAGTRKAHRASAWLAGDDIDGLLVLHSCDNPPCVNPRHLFTGTHSDNEEDKDAKGRRPRGERHGRAVLRRLQVEEILGLLSAGGRAVDLAARFGVSTSLIRAIGDGKVWREVPR